MEKNLYSHPSSTHTVSTDEDTQPRLPAQRVYDASTNYVQSYQQRANRSAEIYDERTQTLAYARVQQPPQPVRQAYSSMQKSSRQNDVLPSTSASGSPAQPARKGTKGAARMAKERALHIASLLKQGVVVASILSLGTFGALAEVHTLNTPVVKKTPTTQPASKSTGATNPQAPASSTPSSQAPTTATPTDSSGSGGTSSTGQNGNNSGQNGNGGYNFGSNNGQGPSAGSSVS